MIYKVIDGKRGKRYLRDGRLMKTADVPEDIIEQLKDHASVELHDKTDRNCVFCGAFGNYPRFINNQTIYTCESDYYDKTVGQIVQKLNQRIKNAEAKTTG